MFVDYATPGLGITRIRFNGYNLSLIVRHPLDVGAKIIIFCKISLIGFAFFFVYLHIKTNLLYENIYFRLYKIYRCR